MTISELIQNLPKNKYEYIISTQAYYNDNMESKPIEGAYLDDENKELVIEW